MNKTVTQIDVLTTAKDNLMEMLKILVLEPDKCINEEVVRLYLTEQFKSRDVAESEEFLNLIIEDFFTLSSHVQYLETTSNNEIKIGKLPNKDPDKALQLILQEVEKIFDSRIEELKLRADKSTENLPEDWIAYDSNSGNKSTDWIKEIAEMQDRINRRRAGEKLTEE